MDVTTVKIRKGTKAAVEKFKESKDSYDHAIMKLVKIAKNKNRKHLLIDGYQANSK